jgi:hypothetical protein
MDIYDGVDWTEMDIDDLWAAIEAGHSRIHRDKRPASRMGSPARVLTVRPSVLGLGALGHSERGLAPGEPRIVPLVKLCQIRQAIYRQLLGIALPSRREAFNISANFLP